MYRTAGVWLQYIALREDVRSRRQPCFRGQYDSPMAVVDTNVIDQQRLRMMEEQYTA